MLSFTRRLGGTGFVAWKSWAESGLPFWPEPRLEALQSRRLQSLVRHAFDHVPRYRNWLRDAGAAPGDIRSARDLGRLPLIDKLELTTDPAAFTTPGADARDGLTLRSSGTSGLGRTFRYDTRALLEALAAGRRQRLALRSFVGREVRYREAVIHREGGASEQIRRFWESRMTGMGAVELQRCRLNAAQGFEELLERLNEFQPHVIRGYGSHLGTFLRWVGESGRSLSAPRAIVYGADAMPEADRRLIEDDLRIPVVSTYQAVEALRIGFQCEVRRGFHLSVDQVAVRVVDPQGREVAPGESGELILTNLANRATVVLNYRLGDLVTRASGPCPCGRTLPLIERIDGRLDDLIARPDGSAIHVLSVIPSLQAAPGVRQVQVVQEQMEVFRLRVVPTGEAGPEARDLRERLLTLLGPGIEVRVELVDRLEPGPGGKVRTIVSLLPRP